ncbi:hypothetical protein Zmor_020637 [Zophobas morio]|uniref:Uncharacterized protein n=1 Tax=Zophobas morio TaxID=2755281 RepID=A0AA38I1N3_9CUCU|nr:hypothetical protein Zmor_020637 [Zophobas morio]
MEAPDRHRSELTSIAPRSPLAHSRTLRGGSSCDPVAPLTAVLEDVQLHPRMLSAQSCVKQFHTSSFNAYRVLCSLATSLINPINPKIQEEA